MLLLLQLFHQPVFFKKSLFKSVWCWLVAVGGAEFWGSTRVCVCVRVCGRVGGRGGVENTLNLHFKKKNGLFFVTCLALSFLLSRTSFRRISLSWDSAFKSLCFCKNCTSCLLFYFDFAFLGIKLFFFRSLSQLLLQFLCFFFCFVFSIPGDSLSLTLPHRKLK